MGALNCQLLDLFRLFVPHVINGTSELRLSSPEGSRFVIARLAGIGSEAGVSLWPDGEQWKLFEAGAEMKMDSHSLERAFFGGHYQKSMLLIIKSNTLLCFPAFPMRRGGFGDLNRGKKSNWEPLSAVQGSGGPTGRFLIWLSSNKKI